jgi:rod shape-determining protein MreD
MNNKLKIVLLLVLVGLQILLNKYNSVIKLNIDLLFLIIVYYSIRTDYYKCIIIGIVIGLITDQFSGNILGVFGFSRTLIAFVLFNFSKFVDFRIKNFLFFYVFLSLSLSNFIANCFFYLINNINIDLKLVFVTPLISGGLAVVLLSVRKIRENLNVY